MRRLLLIRTQSLSPLDDAVTGAEQALPDHQVETLDLTVDNPDYDRLLTAIFEADSVQVW